MKSVAALLIIAFLAGPAASYAGQTEQKTSAAPQPQTAPAATDQKGDAASELPVSIERIRRKLAQAPRAKSGGLGLRLEYYVEVYGKSPRIDLFTDFDPVVGPVQYGSPTHREFLDVVTPEEFRAPAGDLLSPAMALMKWLVERGKKKPAPR